MSTVAEPPAPVTVGAQAPPFRAPTSKGHTLDDPAFHDKPAVVVFFLDDVASDAALTELDGWDEHLVDYGHLRIQVLGVAPGSARAARELADERGLAVTLLADEDGAIRRDFHGEVATAPTVVVDRRGTVAAIVPRTDPVRHAATVLTEVDRLRLAEPESMSPEA